MDAITRLLADLVAIPSVNPMGRALDGPGFLEGRLTDYLERFCRERGLPCERHFVSPGRENLLVRFEAPDARRTILLDAHQDTVPVDGMTIPPFEPTVEGGRLYGRGSCDVKGGLAAMLSAVARLHAERPRGSASVVLACTVDEEFTHTGSSLLARTPTGAELGIVAEPTRLEIVNTHKGAVRWKVRTRGVACHSSTPHLGDNAIYRMARVVEGLRGHAEDLSRSRPDPVLGPPSLSVGRIEGGQSVNIVPDWCEIEIDRRVIPGEDPADIPGRTAQALRDRLGGDLGEVEFLPPWVNMPALSPRVAPETIAVMADAIRRVTGRTPGISGVPYGTDAGPLNRAGLPCVVIGPGDIARAHTKDEWIELDEVRSAAEVYYELARALGA